MSKLFLRIGFYLYVLAILLLVSLIVLIMITKTSIYIAHTSIGTVICAFLGSACFDISGRFQKSLPDVDKYPTMPSVKPPKE